MTALGERPHYELADRWQPGVYPVLLTGVQAIPRMLIEQHARDAAAGLRTATFVSGYQGSPLGGLDSTLAGIAELRTEHDVHLVPGLNEELGATAIWGSQLPLPSGARTHDGVIGVWYGKAPGLDRAADAVRHGTTLGAHPGGGVLVLVGDDPACKSSTLPSASERTLAALGLPVLVPRDAADVIRLGQYGIALSRASGCWVGMKLVADVADGVWSVASPPAVGDLTAPLLEWDGKPWHYQQHTVPAPPATLRAEAELAGPRWAMVQAFAAAHPVDVAVADTADAWLTIVAVGTAAGAAEQALHGLGLDGPALDRAGVRLLRLNMPYPLNASAVRHAVRGVTDVLVIEEKGSFVESQLRDVLYGTAASPRILGKRDADGGMLVPPDGELTSSRLEPVLRAVLAGRVSLRPEARQRTTLTVLPTSRTPYFCSGCPHNRSTVVPEGSLAAGGIGCHAMVALVPRDSSAITTMTQMGGEGAQWIGQAPFTDVGHLFQNMGDGTYFHSGQLAVQACVAAGVNITFKLLYNSAVAMTGGQDATGALDVPAVTRKLHTEGVRRIIVCSDDPRRYGRRAGFAPGVDVWHRDRLDEAQKVLRTTAGVTVLIYDQQCAAEARRLRKRGVQPTPSTRVIINEAVCEGCGDCGRKSNCLSVQPVDTEFGRKTRIDQTSCNADYSCLDGDCPSFVTVEARPTRRRSRAVTPPSSPEPERSAPSDRCDVFLAGIGGTGIVTVNQVLATAALIEGMHASGLDQTGLSQKAGPVTSHLRLARDGSTSSNRVAPAGAACYLAFDALVGADPRHLAAADPGLTIGVVSTSTTPTGAMVLGTASSAFDADETVARIAGACRDVVVVDATRAAEALLGNAVAANVLLVGAAYQRGALPLSATAIEEAIRLNGVAVEANIAAFRWGRLAVADPAAFERAVGTTEVAAPPTYDLAGSPLAGETRRAVAIRAADLRRYQNDALARDYVAFVERVWNAERAVTERIDLSLAVTRALHRLTAYKDEYEVAALLTDRAFLEGVSKEFPGAVGLRFRLHPPALRAMGLQRKVALGVRWTPVLKALAACRGLRGTTFDPFGRTALRRLERELVREYRGVIEKLIATLDEVTYDDTVAVAEAALLVRGYEHIKLESVDRYRERLAELGVTEANGTPSKL